MFEIFISNNVTALVNFITLIGVVANTIFYFRNNYISNQRISIVFDVEGEKYLAKYPILRKHISRAELKGVLRDMLKQGSGNFDIKYLANKEFIEKLLKVQEGNGNEIILKLKKNEFEVFDKGNFEKLF